MSQPKVKLVGISGCSSSGKTTLARLLRDIWPNSFVIHQDDFYWPDNQIPVRKGIQDWDCLEAFDLDKFRKCLDHVRRHGSLPASFQSIQDGNAVEDCKVNPAAIDSWREAASQQRQAVPFVFVDGFLLYPHAISDIRNMFDLRLFLRTGFDAAKKRREARSGYSTIQGFWEDPPGYVEDIVWPNYVNSHAFMFRNGKVEGEANDEACDWLGIDLMPKYAEEDMTACLNWACEILRKSMTYS